MAQYDQVGSLRTLLSCKLEKPVINGFTSVTSDSGPRRDREPAITGVRDLADQALDLAKEAHETRTAPAARKKVSGDS